MSLDIRLVELRPIEIWSENITHDLAFMAREVKLTNDLNLYLVLWRPYECDPPLQKASDVVEYLNQAQNQLLSEPERYKEYNPNNGWGDYMDLLYMVQNYRRACVHSPDAKIQVSR